MDYWKQQGGGYLLIPIGDAKAERVSSFKFLSVHITDVLAWSLHMTSDLSWSLHMDTMVKEARQRLYFLRKLVRNAGILTNFYRCTMGSLLKGCLMVWRVVEAAGTAQCIDGNRLPAIQDIFHQWFLRKSHSIIKDHSHPAHRLVSLSPSGRGYRNMAVRTIVIPRQTYQFKEISPLDRLRFG